MDGSSAIKNPAGQSPTTGKRHSPIRQVIGTHLLRDRLETDGLRSGDLGDFASFVTHMKQIAIVSSLSLLIAEPHC